MVLRALHTEAFKYVFEQLDKRMILATIASTNAKSIKLCGHLGFSELFRIPDGYAVGVDQVVLQILREDCKYIDKFKEAA